MTVAIIDYGMGNLGSVRRAVEECGHAVFITDEPEDLFEVEKIILPGVGAYRDGMRQLYEGGWIAPIEKAVNEEKIPLLGICLGMQLLANKSYENGTFDGLRLIPGEVRKLEPSEGFHERVPHVGWNGIENIIDHPLLEDIPEGTDFYFVHSYHFCPKDTAHVLATTEYCGSFVSVVGYENVMGTQFHPEKSSRPGRKVLHNFLRI